MTDSSTSLRQTIHDLARARKEQLTAAGLIAERASPIGTYTWNSRIKFGVGTDSRQFMGAGWSIDETGFVWTEGMSTRLTLRASPPPGDIICRMRARALVPPGRLAQPFRVRLNGVTVLRWAIDGVDAWYIGRLFNHQFDPQGTIQLLFESEMPIAPRALGFGADDRLLGVAVAELILEVIS